MTMIFKNDELNPMYAKMDTKHGNDMKRKHDTICNHAA
ncbi:hypothetical protein CsSME_00043375 [Camellia sinensis var. sinensis]